MHTCPLVNPGPVPHVGGPIITGAMTVHIGFLPAARQTDNCFCVGPIDKIAMGSPTVYIENKMAARIGDPTVHGGVIVSGFPPVLIGAVGMGRPVLPGAPIAPSGPDTPGGNMDKNPPPVEGGGGGPGAPQPKEVLPKPPPQMTPVQSTPQQQAMSEARESGRPFCELCES